jgi:DNA-binding NtrC family response regulator
MLELLGFAVIAVTRPEDAFGLASDPILHIDLLVTEFSLGTISAYTLVSFLKTRKPNAKALILCDDLPLDSKHEEVGAFMLEKPFNEAELNLAVVSALEGSRVV